MLRKLSLGCVLVCSSYAAFAAEDSASLNEEKQENIERYFSSYQLSKPKPYLELDRGRKIINGQFVHGSYDFWKTDEKPLPKPKLTILSKKDRYEIFWLLEQFGITACAKTKILIFSLVFPQCVLGIWALDDKYHLFQDS
jgi:hypothetical protein